MRVLIACEESQTVCKAFRKRGHEAYSCDLEPCSGGHPEWHIQEDVLKIIYNSVRSYGVRWDMMIAFPPCTHLAVSGARYFEQKRKDGRQQEAIDFFMAHINAPIDKIAVENPVGIMSTEYRKPDQIIQPWMFGDDASKKTCLWLKGLPILLPTHSSWKKRYSNQTPSGQNKLGPSPDRARLRSITYPGIAEAMAEQWNF